MTHLPVLFLFLAASAVILAGVVFCPEILRGILQWIIRHPYIVLAAILLIAGCVLLYTHYYAIPNSEISVEYTSGALGPWSTLQLAGYTIVDGDGNVITKMFQKHKGVYTMNGVGYKWVKEKYGKRSIALYNTGINCGKQFQNVYLHFELTRGFGMFGSQHTCINRFTVDASGSIRHISSPKFGTEHTTFAFKASRAYTMNEADEIIIKGNDGSVLERFKPTKCKGVCGAWNTNPASAAA
ncbi:MAG: hypothetical protein MJ014_00040 [Methanocorpusculum sp.]|nr:hypothetical protein [Methanocorpusculum sp.]